MGCRIIGEQSPGTVWNFQGNVTLTITPNGTMQFVPEAGTLGDPPGYNDFLGFLNATVEDAANQTIAKSGTQYGQQYDGVQGQRFARRHLGITQPYRNAEVAIRDGYINNYIINNNYRPAAHLQYPLGLYHNYLDFGHAASLDVFDNVLESTPLTHRGEDNWRHQVYSREIAYPTLWLLHYEKMVGVGNTNLSANGKDAIDRYPHLVTCMENHIYQWRYNDYSDPAGVTNTAGASDFMKCFMVAITCYTLGKYYDHMLETRGNGNLFWPTTNFSDIPTAILSMLVWMMDFATVPSGSLAGNRIYREGGSTWSGGPSGSGSFYYIDRDTSGVGSPGSVAPDLNMLIAAPYAWLAKHYGQSSFITLRADPLFYGATSILGNINPSISSGLDMKHVNQQLVWQEDFFNWRGMV